MRSPPPPSPRPPFEVRLRDGTRALIRPVDAADRELLERGFARLSDRSRYLRFHAPVAVLSDAQLRYFTDIDHHDHVAFAALDLDHPEEPGMGVARSVRLAREPDVAEAAVTVLDDYQGRGLGTVLLGVLAGEARAHGIRALRAYVLVDNAAMLRLFEDLGARRAYDGDGVYRVDLPLPADPDDVPRTPAGAVLRAVARGTLPPMASALPPLWAEGPPPSGPSGDALAGP